MKNITQTELSPDMLVKSIKARKIEIERGLKEREYTLRGAPAGTLRITMKGQYLQYYHRVNPSDIIGVYLNRAQDSFAFALAQKDYDSKLIGELKTEIKALDRVLAEYRPEKIDDIFLSLHDFRKPLIRPAKLLDEEYVKRWMSVDYEKKVFEENTPDYFTSKSE
jgi:hypothetical protein